VRYRHEESKQTIEVTGDQVPIYESQGWVKVQPAAKPATEKPKTPAK